MPGNTFSATGADPKARVGLIGEMIIGSLQAGLKYVGTEVMLGTILPDHWDVVKAAEQHQAHVMMLENVCYRRDVMTVLNMVR